MPKRKSTRRSGGDNMGTMMAKADMLFSVLIRLKDMMPNGYIACYTCGEQHHFKEMQCGHFVGRSHKATRWLEENARPQCYKCNVSMRGNLEEYQQRLEIDHPGIVAHLNAIRNDPKFRLKEADVVDIIEEIKERIKQYGGEKSIPQK